MVSVGSAYAAGLLGVVIANTVGPDLGRGAQLWFGNTEAEMPAASYPWFLTVIAAVAPIPFAARREWALATVVSLGLVAVPMWHLYSLYRVASG